MQLQPREQFAIVRQIEDPNDNSTYYVQAVVRNAKTDALLSTLALTDRGSRRFSVAYPVPADPSGQGFYISILTTVYTDSGYTTKSDIYGEKIETYLVQDRYNLNLGGVGGGADIDYKKIRKIVEEVVNDHMETMMEKMPKMPEIVKVPTEVVVIKDKLVKQDMPKFPSLQPLIQAISGLGDKIDNQELPEPKEPDLSPILSAIERIASISSAHKDELASLLKETLDKNTSRFNKIEQVKKILAGFDEEPSDVSSSPKKETKPTVDPRISKLLTR